jgi:K+-transporting ATPase KdpF subunit
MKGVLYVAEYVNAWCDVFCRPSGIYLGVRPVVKGGAMSVLIIIVTILCFGYLVYAMIRPERF